MKKTLLLSFYLFYFSPLIAQSHILELIKQTSSDSLIMKDVSYLSDVYGPRFLGTPNYYASVKYLQEKLETLGISTRLDSFDNNLKGWGYSDFKISMVEPNYAPIHGLPLAYSISTNGTQEGELIFSNSLQEVYNLKGNLEGKIIMLEALYHPVSNVETSMSKRLTEHELLRAASNPDPNHLMIGYHTRRSVPGLLSDRTTYKNRMTTFFEFLKDEGVIALFEPSNNAYGVLHADGNRAVPSFSKMEDIEPISSFVIANEDFGRLLRLHEMGFNPKLQLTLTSSFYSEPLYNQNLIAEIEGKDPNLKDELVIIGAHLDSWHGGTGAVDNAANAALLIEVMRILNTLNVENNRTIRLVLWGGEEHVFAGSKSFVHEYVGNMETGEPYFEHYKISAYLNLDNGAGKIRGLYLMGNQDIEPYFAEYLQPFNGNNYLTIQNANQTDHWLFDYHNIPAFQFIQDPMDYISAVHHTNMDRYEYVPKEDQKFNAELVAYLVYQISQEQHLLPRKPHNYIVPNTSGNVTFSLPGFENAKEVSVIGDFNNWDMFNVPMYKVMDGWETSIELPTGKYYYKFIVDGNWTNDPETPEIELRKDGKGHAGLTVFYVD